MIIDLNKDTNLNYAETSFELAQLKSNRLIKEIVMQRNKTGQNFMIVPMSIYNILEANKSFKFAPLDSLMDEDILRHMGSINGIEVYLDLFSPSDTIILKYDKSIMRDNKIDAILNGEELKEEIEITILNY
jgi:hypothetical protein